MADRISMTLDDIIAAKTKKAAPKKAAAVVKSSNGPKVGKFQRETAEHRANKREQFIQSSNPSRVMKVVTLERPKIVNPTFTVQASSAESGSGSVFERLSSPDAAVKFQNLKNTVVETDIRELCNAIGKVKAITLENAGLHRVASVIFQRERDAEQCVAKYNGLVLDGSPMRVVIDKVAAASATTVFARLQAPSAVPVASESHSNGSSNIREGLFGTALSSSSNGSSRIVHVQKQQVRAVNVHPKGKGPKGPKPANAPKKAVQPVDLDEDLDNYMAQR